jgi:hypothetical protein
MDILAMASLRACGCTTIECRPKFQPGNTIDVRREIESDPRFTRAIGFARAESLCAKFALNRQKCKGDATEKFFGSDLEKPVSRLSGSGAREDSDPTHGNIDLFCEFDDDHISLSDRFFGLMEDPEKLVAAG